MLDSHQHFWTVSRDDYAWMTDDVAALRRDFTPDDLRSLLARAGVKRTIVVQAAETEAETAFLLDLAAKTDFVAGVVGWLDMDDDRFPDRLARHRTNPLFVGLRPMLHDLPDGWILRPHVLANLALMADAGVPFDVLSRIKQLPDVIEALRRVPGLRAVLNHMAKPEIAAGRFEPWRSLIAEAAAIPGLHCKVSGMVTEAAHGWQLDDMRPYVAHACACFGEDRLMFGSDWPVATLAASYAEVIHVARTLVAEHVSSAGISKVFSVNAARFYGVAINAPSEP